jgi:hypothetical protein
VTDFGRTLQPLLTWYEINTVAGDTLYFFAIAAISESPRRGEPGNQLEITWQGRPYPTDSLIPGGSKLARVCLYPRTTSSVYAEDCMDEAPPVEVKL